MVAPVDQTSDERAFEKITAVYQPGEKNQCNALERPAGRASMAEALIVRTTKSATNDFVPVLPREMGQAPPHDEALYDQKHNVVLYSVFYDQRMCEAKPGQPIPPLAKEIKVAWRILAPDDPSIGDYYTLQAKVAGVSPDPVTLGMVGFHLVINSPNHPEFIWSTFEHKSNAPTCTDLQEPPEHGSWSFTSDGCVSQPEKCTFNVGHASKSLKGTPTEVCQKYAQGTPQAPTTGGNDNDLNRRNIQLLNEQLVGPAGFLTKLPANDQNAVWKNYRLIGTLYTQDGQSSKLPDVQRGSLKLANPTLETFSQDANCFTCHVYTEERPLGISHIIQDLIPQSS